MINTILSDRIERFIMDELRKQEEPTIILKRKDVAELLDCAPSQVTYVINTRFSQNHRFIVESRRGNGGFIRIAVRSVEKESAPEDAKEPHQTVEDQLDTYFHMLVSSGAITMREFLMTRELLHLVTKYCPEDRHTAAAKEAVNRIGRILREGK